jgi:Fe-S-cluster containining protein
MSTETIQTTFIPESGIVLCRAGCGACCIAPSISSAIPEMPQGKPAGVRCVQLNELNQCLIFGLPSRPLVCASLMPTLEMCGHNAAEAFAYLERLEIETQPVELLL